MQDSGQEREAVDCGDFQIIVELVIVVPVGDRSLGKLGVVVISKANLDILEAIPVVKLAVTAVSQAFPVTDLRRRSLLFSALA